MTKKIFKSSILVAAAVLIFGIACVMAILYQHFGKQINTELKKEATYLVYGVEENGIDYLKQIKEKDDRITYIAEDGTVLYDNQADAATMENHGDRKEIQEALKTGSGHAERTSKTLSQKTLYYALRLSDNSVLRVSSTQYSVWVLLMELVPPLIGIAVVMLILTAIMSVHMANKIVEPINNVDLEHPEENQIYEEVGPLLSKIYKQNRQIKSQLEVARRNQEEFGIITENMQEGLLVIDSYTMILSGNSSAWKLFQLKDPKIGDSVYSLNRNEDFRLLIEQVLKGQHGSVLLHMGSEAIQMIANPVNREHRVVGAVILLMNETEKVEREQLRREFSANVSHELKTPLTSILGFGDLLRIKRTVDDKERREYAGIIVEETKRLKTLSGKLMELITVGSTQLDWQTIPLTSIMEEVGQALQISLSKSGITLNIKVCKIEVSVDKELFKSLIYNLIDNAIKASKSGQEIEVFAEETNGILTIAVKDHGIGIPKEEINKIMQPFYMIDKSRTRKAGGAGLGLALCSEIARLHGARLQIESEPRKGTCVSIIFDKKGETE